MILEKNPINLQKLISGLAHSDEAIRFWSICGLAYLGSEAKSAGSAIQLAMKDPHIEVSTMAYYAMGTTQGQAEEMVKRLKAKLKNSEALAIHPKSIAFIRCIMKLLQS